VINACSQNKKVVDTEEALINLIQLCKCCSFQWWVSTYFGVKFRLNWMQTWYCGYNQWSGRGEQPVWACANLVPRFFSPLSPRWKTLETRLDWGDRVILYYLWRYELHSLYCVRQQKEQKGYCFFLSCLFVCFLPHELYSHTVCLNFALMDP